MTAKEINVAKEYFEHRFRTLDAETQRKEKLMCGIAYRVLRLQQEAGNNAPLTLDELRDIAESGEYGAHIWVKDLVVGDVVAAVTNGFRGQVVAVWAIDEYYWEQDYGKTWLAYRYKPENKTLM